MSEEDYVGVLYNGILRQAHFVLDGRMMRIDECGSLDAARRAARALRRHRLTKRIAVPPSHAS